LPFLAVRFADSLRFSDSAGAWELAILKKSEDRSNNSRPVSAPPCDARRLEGETKIVPIGNDCGYCGTTRAESSPLLKGGGSEAAGGLQKKHQRTFCNKISLDKSKILR
jgi:hypothetical protein